MEDVSLDDLLSQLQKAQEQKSAVRLSERNVVELVSKLRQLGFLGDDLLHSINGREYLTPDHLCKEVKEAVLQAGGRIALVDLPAQLGVDLVHCEVQAARLVEDSGGSMLAVQGELITQAYFDNLAAEVDELLQEAGVVVLGDLARRFNLGADLLLSTIGPRVGPIIHGRLESGLLYTSAHIARIRAQLRGALRGAAAPVSIPALLKDMRVEGGTNFGKAAASIIDDMVADGSLKGSLRAGATTWIPSVYSHNQQSAVANFYKQNGYIEYDTVTKLGISGAQAYLTTTFPGGIALASAYAAPELVTQLDAQAVEAAAGTSWLDMLPYVPSVLSHADAAALLARCPSQQHSDKGRAGSSGGLVLAGTCVLSPAFLEEVQRRALEYARTSAEEALQQRRASAKSCSASAPSAGSKGSAASKKGAPQAAGTGGSDDDDWADAKGKKGKKGRGKGGAGPPAKASKSGKGGAAPAKPAAASKADDGAERWLGAEPLTAKVVEWYPDTEGAGEEKSLPSALAVHVRQAALAEFEKALAAVFLAGAEARRRRRDEAAAALDAAHQRLQLYAKGAELLEADNAAATAVERHLVRGLGAEALDALLRHQQVEAQEEAESSEAADLSAFQRNAIIAALPKDVAMPMAAAVEQLTGASANEMVAALEAAAEAAGLRLRKLDKKAEKALLASVRTGLEGQLTAEEEPAQALSLALPILALQVHGRAVSVPGRALAPLINSLKGGVSDEVYRLLLDFHGSVVACLKAQGSPDGAERAAALREELCSKLPGLRAATASPKGPSPPSEAAADS